MNTVTSFPRRQFLAVSGVAFLTAAAVNHVRAETPTRAGNRLFFVSQGKTALINADGSGLRYFAFDVPNQATWQPCQVFPDGRRVVFLSMEPRRDGPGKPFGEYYHLTPTHLWIHDLDTGTLTEIATKDRMAPFYTPQLLLNEERILIQVVGKGGAGQLYSMNLDGSDAKAFTQAGDGMPYGLSLSPDGRRVAYHLASPSGYQIWVCDADGENKKLVTGNPEHLYFAPCWSPDGEWLAFQDCRYKEDPGHDWSDAVICRPDGSEMRALTQGQALWFAASYGTPENKGNGSNVPAWTRDGALLCAKRLPDAKAPWEFQTQRPDTDHFNRDYKPDAARGGVEICRIAPKDGVAAPLTQPGAGVWDFRASESSDGAQVAFCRAATGEVPALWVMDADGKNARMLTRGLEDKGADHPRWVPRA